MTTDSDPLRIVDIQPSEISGYVLTASEPLHRQGVAFKALLVIEVAAYRSGARNLPLEASTRYDREPTECWVNWPGGGPTVEQLNAALEQAREKPPVLEIADYGMPGCLLVRCGDRVGEIMLSFLLGAQGVERVAHLSDVPYYDEQKTLIVTKEVGYTTDQVSEAMREATRF